jgi:hypothetical protein
MNADQLRKLALSLPDSTEAPHFDRSAFRTPRRIFATLAPDGRSANLKLELDQQAALVDSHPKAFAVIAGHWGLRGWTTMTLAAISMAEAKSVLVDAHAAASPAARKPAKAKGAVKRKR